MNYDRSSELVQPHYVIEEINRHTRGEAIITTGVGQHQMWAAQMFDFRDPRLWLTSGSMGTMGFGLPAAIGAQVANPGRLVIDFDGDASIRMNIGELETVDHLRPADQGRGAEQLRRWHGQAVAEAVLQGPAVRQRQVAAQEGFHPGGAAPTAFSGRGGWTASRTCRAWSRSSSASRARRFWRSSSIRTPASIRWSGPGLGYDAMITGDFIAARPQDAAPGEYRAVGDVLARSAS